MDAYLCANAHLRRYDLSVRDLSRYIEQPGDDECVLLVGSVPEGLSTSSSDVDLLSIGGSPVTSLMEGAVTTEAVEQRPEGFPLNVTAWPYKSSRRLLERFRDGIAALRNLSAGPSSSKVQFFSREEFALLHRFANGVPVAGHSLVASLRAEYGLADLPLQMLFSYASLYGIVLGDSRAQLTEGDSLDALLMARYAVDMLMGAMLASIGETNPIEKWRLRLLRRHADILGRSAVSRVTALMFPSPTNDAEAFVHDVGEYSRVEIVRALRRVPVAARALSAFDSLAG